MKINIFQVIFKHGRIHGNPVADGWTGAVPQKLLGIQKCDRRTDVRTDGWTDKRTDGQTDQPTNTARCRVACPRLKTDSTIQLRENNESKPNVILSLNLDMYKRQCLSVCHLIYLSACSVVVQLSLVLTWNAADSALIAQTSPHSNVLKFFLPRITFNLRQEHGTSIWEPPPPNFSRFHSQIVPCIW